MLVNLVMSAILTSCWIKFTSTELFYQLLMYCETTVIVSIIYWACVTDEYFGGKYLN